MQIRKWLALLVSAALALSLLAGCGNGSKALSDVIADLLSGQYANVTVEIDPDLEGDLRQAVHEGETDAEIRAALEKILGSGVSFRLIGDGQQGDSAFDLILYPGNDPDAAARSAFTEWNKVFGSLPRDGQYTAQIAMIETENGYAILVQATVDKAASRDDDDDEPEDLVVKGTGFTYNVTKNTITVGPDGGETNGLQELFFDADVDDKVEAARADGFAGVTITLAANTPYTVSNTFTTAFKGILKGESPTNKATVTLQNDCDGLFAQIGKEDGGPDDNGKVENITFDVQTTITNTYADRGGSCVAGAVAGSNHGNITNCDVTINSGYTIQATTSESSSANAGGLVGYNDGTITACTVTINGSITDRTVTINGSISATSGSVANAGGIAGDNEGEGKIEGNSQVTLNSGGSIQAQATGTWSVSASAGGLVGQNTGTVTKTATYSGTGTDTIKAEVKNEDANYEASVPYTDDKDTTHCTKTDVKARAGTMIGFDWRADEPGPVSKL